ncbi:MAG: right-handed parallel beta-helix repeat-containing protein [Prolixibacteraceae bacterium]|jgi:polygalacturonase|nr:right-handed parallel beta-helix repeat-containing protein [Prolixibacteraceae bacterium]
MKNFVIAFTVILLIFTGSCKRQEIFQKTSDSSTPLTLKSGSLALKEAESLTVSTSGQHSPVVTPLPDASNGNISELYATAVNEWIQYTINITTAGTYNIQVMSSVYTHRGIGRLYLDGTAKGPDIDQYKGTEPNGYIITDMGDAVLSAGNHTFKFQVVGKNASSPAYSLSFDYIDLTPINEAESLTVTTSGQHSAVLTPVTGASNGYIRELYATAVNEWIQYTINIARAGNYNIKVMSSLYINRAIVRLYLDGAVKGPDIDQYKALPNGWAITDMGNAVLSAGNHTFKFHAISKNASSSNYFVSFDYIKLTFIISIPTLAATNPVTAITQTTATSGGNVTGGASVTARGVCWSTSPNPTIANSKTTNGTGTGTFTSSITGLTAGTLYYVRAYATNSGGTGYGTQVSFTTTSGLPTLAPTNTVTAITQTTATSGGNVTGGAGITARGVCWSTSPNPTIANPKTINGTGTGIFTSAITGLTTNTLYYVRAYATNSSGTAYGTQVSFTSGLYVNVMSTGATGNGVTDDTAAIQAAINQVAGTGGTVIVPNGTYMINAIQNGWQGLLLASNMTFSMSSGAVLKAFPNDRANYVIIEANNVSNVKIIGGTVQGERYNHTGTTGESGYGIGIDTGNNITIDGVTTKDCWGDGIFISGSPAANPSTNITVKNVVSDSNRRQGLSVVSADGVIIQNSTFKNTIGTLPEAGIDLEPDGNATLGVKNIQILNCQCFNNHGNQIDVYAGNTRQTAKPMSGIIIDNNTLTSQTSPNDGVRIRATDGVKVRNNNMVVSRYGFNLYLTTGNTITGNTIDIGVQAIVGDDGGNIISGNIIL